MKLYNKAVESSLDYPLTRLELTLDPAVPFEKVNWPGVYYLDAPSILFDKVRITETERFIIGAILNGFGSVHDLGRKTRAKIQRQYRVSEEKLKRFISSEGSITVDLGSAEKLTH